MKYYERFLGGFDVADYELHKREVRDINTSILRLMNDWKKNKEL
ncbi:hypothetical protein Mgra_00002765 [Meloidogyne graminicola]|uniref:Uncharacterized protein n=1 Tax=Meloidogyne graminicola TaxID=189291 RepID=A0A8S9ZWZ7_9BILA|nr:hypothetical protein Mgra_00002765 [Meloidogyne graminicola]